MYIFLFIAIILVILLEIIAPYILITSSYKNEYNKYSLYSVYFNVNLLNPGALKAYKIFLKASKKFFFEN